MSTDDQPGNDQPDYADTPASAFTTHCRECQGDGWRFVPRVAVVDGRSVTVMKAEPCDECRPADGSAPTGRIDLGAGPGAKLRRWERVPLPGDGWGPTPSSPR